MGVSFKLKNPVKSFSDSITKIGSNPLEGLADLGLKSVTGGQVGTDDVTGRNPEEEAKQAERKRQAQIASSLSAGRQQGLDLAKIGYGQGLEQTGQDIQRVRELQRARTEGSDPVSEAIRNQKAGNIASMQRNLAASGVKGGVAAGALDEVARRQDADIAASLYGQQRQNIQDERSLASNTLAGTTSLMFGSAGEANAANMPKAPEAQGAFGTVICTELYEQNYYSTELYMRDVAYGAWIRTTKPEVYEGYITWAIPVVKLMRKSKTFTKLVAFFAVPWAQNMAYGNNKFGAAISMIGEPICGIIGKIKSTGVKYARG